MSCTTQNKQQHSLPVLPQRPGLLTFLLLLPLCQNLIHAAPTATSMSTPTLTSTATTFTNAAATNDSAAVDTTDALIVVDERIVLLWPNGTDDNQQQQLQQNVDNESALDVADDLIILTKAPTQPSTPGAGYQQIDLLTSDEEATLAVANSNSNNNNNCSDGNKVNGDLYIADAADGAVVATAGPFGGPHQIELHRSGAAPPVTPIDMTDFVTLIPAEEVKSIAVNYYHNDAEVRRAYTYLRSPYFVVLRQHIVELPEVATFLRYLNDSGLDVMRFLYALTNLTDSVHIAASSEEADDENSEESLRRNEPIMGNEITKNDYIVPQVVALEATTTNLVESNSQTKPASAVLPTVLENTSSEAAVPTAKISETTISPTPSAPSTSVLHVTSMTPEPEQQQETQQQTQQPEQLNGLHGLVDSILEILPQDQILATFFDKLETNEQFSKLVNDIGSPAFAKILSKMQQSVPLRNLIFTLHNNGIYVTRIVDSLKAYFFLGGFS